MNLLTFIVLAGAMYLGCLAHAQEIKITDLSAGAKIGKAEAGQFRCAGYKLTEVPEELKSQPMVFVLRGDSNKPAAAYSFTIDKPATIYLFVHNRGKIELGQDWEKTPMKAVWTAGNHKLDDSVFKKDFPAGKIEVPTHEGKDGGGSFGIPHLAVIKLK